MGKLKQINHNQQTTPVFHLPTYWTIYLQNLRRSAIVKRITDTSHILIRNPNDARRFTTTTKSQQKFRFKIVNNSQMASDKRSFSVHTSSNSKRATTTRTNIIGIHHQNTIGSWLDRCNHTLCANRITGSVKNQKFQWARSQN